MFSCFSRQIPTTAFAAPVVSLSPMWALPINPDLVARPQSGVSFQSHFLTLLLWPFHCSVDPSGCELMQGWGKAPWYSGQLTHAHLYCSHGHLHWAPCPSLFLQLHLRAVPLHRAGRPSAPSVSAIPFPSRYSFAFFQSWSYFASSCCISDSLPPHSISCLTSAEIIFWLQILWVSHTHWFPPVWMSLLYLAPAAAARSPRHGESGTLNSNLPLLITSLYPETAIWLNQIPEYQLLSENKTKNSKEVISLKLCCQSDSRQRALRLKAVHFLCVLRQTSWVRIPVLNYQAVFSGPPVLLSYQ